MSAPFGSINSHETLSLENIKETGWLGLIPRSGSEKLCILLLVDVFFVLQAEWTLSVC